MPDIDFIRGEIERMRAQVVRQRKEILPAPARRHRDGFGGSAAGADAGQDREPLRSAGRP